MAEALSQKSLAKAVAARLISEMCHSQVEDDVEHKRLVDEAVAIAFGRLQKPYGMEHLSALAKEAALKQKKCDEAWQLVFEHLGGAAELSGLSSRAVIQ